MIVFPFSMKIILQFTESSSARRRREGWRPRGWGPGPGRRTRGRWIWWAWLSGLGTSEQYPAPSPRSPPSCLNTLIYRRPVHPRPGKPTQGELEGPPPVAGAVHLLAALQSQDIVAGDLETQNVEFQGFVKIILEQWFELPFVPSGERLLHHQPWWCQSERPFRFISEKIRTSNSSTSRHTAAASLRDPCWVIHWTKEMLSYSVWGTAPPAASEQQTVNCYSLAGSGSRCT